MVTRSWLLAQYLKSHDIHTNETILHRFLHKEMAFHMSLKVHYLHQATVELSPPNNHREETGLPTPTCPQETIYSPFLGLAMGIVIRNSVEVTKFINDT